MDKELLFFKELDFLKFIFVLFFVIQIRLQRQKMADMSLEKKHMQDATIFIN